MVIHVVFLLKVIKNIKNENSFWLNTIIILLWSIFFAYLFREASPTYDPAEVFEMRILVFILLFPSLIGIGIVMIIMIIRRVCLLNSSLQRSSFFISSLGLF